MTSQLYSHPYPASSVVLSWHSSTVQGVLLHPMTSGREGAPFLLLPAISASTPWQAAHPLLVPSMTSPQKFSALLLPLRGEALVLHFAVVVSLHPLFPLVVGERTRTTVPL